VVKNPFQNISGLRSRWQSGLLLATAAMVSLAAWAPLWAEDSAATQPANSQAVGPTTQNTSAAENNAPPAASDPDFRPAQVGSIIFVQNQPSLFVYNFSPLTFQNATLFDVLGKLAGISSTNLVAGWPALAKAGVNPKTRLSFDLPEQGYRDELVGVLREYAPKVFMVISADQNVIFINTRDADDQQLVVRDYWVQDLMANLPRIVQAGTNLETIDAVASTQPGKPVAKPPMETNILEFISSTVRPEIWVNHGGKATMSLIGDRVIVEAPLNVQAILDGPKTYNPDAAPLYIMYGQ
jgi:hypothetical protein